MLRKSADKMESISFVHTKLIENNVRIKENKIS